MVLFDDENTENIDNWRDIYKLTVKSEYRVTLIKRPYICMYRQSGLARVFEVGSWSRQVIRTQFEDMIINRTYRNDVNVATMPVRLRDKEKWERCSRLDV